MTTTLTRADGYATIAEPATLTISRLLPGTADRLWSYLTDGDLRARWLAAGRMELAEGSAFTLRWRNDDLSEIASVRPASFAEEQTMDSRITEVDPPHRLSFTWADTGEVTFDLDERGDGVLLTITHRRIVDRELMLCVSAGWHTHLDILEAVLSGSPRPAFWDAWTARQTEYASRLQA